MTEKRFYVDSSGDLWDRQSNDILMMDFGLFGNGSETEEIVDMLNELNDENTKLKEHQNINCQNCQYFVSDSASSDCLKREDIGYKGICIDGMDLHKLAKNCPYYY